MPHGRRKAAWPVGSHNRSAAATSSPMATESCPESVGTAESSPVSPLAGGKSVGTAGVAAEVSALGGGSFERVVLRSSRRWRSRLASSFFRLSSKAAKHASVA